MSLSQDSLPFSDAQLQQLEMFCTFVQKNPDVVHEPKMEFFKKFLLDMGCTEISSFKLNIDVNKDAVQELKKKPTIQEIDVHERKEEVVVSQQMDEELPAHYLSNMGDTFMSTKESLQQAVEAKKRAVQAFNEKSYKKSALLFGRAIYLSGGKFAPLFMKRAECHYEMGKYMSARRDATQSIALQGENNFRAYKIRGKANFALKNWIEAKHDLEVALKDRNSIDEEVERLLGEAKSQVSSHDKSIYFASEASKSKTASTSNSVPKPSNSLKKTSSSSVKSSLSSTQSSKQSSSSTANSSQSIVKKAANTIAKNSELSKEQKENAVKEISKDKEMMKKFTSPDLSKMLDDISKDPNMFFKYKETNPEIVDLFGSFINVMSQQK